MVKLTMVSELLALRVPSNLTGNWERVMNWVGMAGSVITIGVSFALQNVHNVNDHNMGRSILN